MAVKDGREPRRMTEKGSGLRSLPSVSDLLAHPALAMEAARIGEQYRVAIVRAALAAERARLQRDGGNADPDSLAAAIGAQISRLVRPKLTRLLNATGVILHTNLGRAPVSPAAAEAMREAASAYVPLEFDPAAGARGGRMSEPEALFQALTGCEAALVVNNNAAATMLVLAAVLRPDAREVIVARSEAVEIGGSFRIPDILRQSGATLVDIGTTNRTYTRDYVDAITEQTAAILKVHTSNFRISGFVHTVASADLVPIADARGVPLIDDLGSGALLDTTRYGIAAEPMVQASVASGAHMVCASGDKLLGGPQAGIILGKRMWVQRCAAHPLARAVRADKATLAGLAATLRHYLRGDAKHEIPVWRMIAADLPSLRSRCLGWAAALAGTGGGMEVMESAATVGGGSLPGETLPSYALTFSAGALRDGGWTLDALATRLRLGEPAIVPRIERDRLWLDARTVLPEDDDAMIAALSAALGASS